MNTTQKYQIQFFEIINLINNCKRIYKFAEYGSLIYLSENAIRPLIKPPLRVSNLKVFDFIRANSTGHINRFHLTFSNLMIEGFKDGVIENQYNNLKLEFVNCTFVEDLIFDRFEDVHELSFTDAEFVNVKLNIERRMNIQIVNSLFNELQIFNQLNSHLHLRDIKASKILMSNSNLNELKITGFIEGSFSIYGYSAKFPPMKNTYSTVKNFTLESHSNVEYLFIDKLIINRFLLKGFQSTKSKIILKEIKVGNLEFVDFVSSGLVWIKGMKLQEDLHTKLSIINTTVSDFLLSNAPLILFETIIINGSNLSNIRCDNTVFPIEKLNNMEMDSSTLKQIYEDLSQASLKQNNKHLHLKYYKASQESLLKTTSLIKEPGTFLSLLISKIYSSFGTKWLQSVCVTIFIVGVLFFSSMMLSTTHDIDISSKGLNEFWRLKADFAKFMNPTHKLNFMDLKYNYKYSDEFCFIFWDSLGRILIAIGIFETIRSFRKYTRK